MTEKTIIDFTILSVTFASAFVIVGYEDHARMKGWPVGAWLVGGTSFLKILAFVTMLISLGASFYLYKWWSPIVVFASGFVLGFLASELLTYRVQIFAVLGTVIGWVLCLTYVL
jgi:hypothetical protein